MIDQLNRLIDEVAKFEKQALLMYHSSNTIGKELTSLRDEYERFLKGLGVEGFAARLKKLEAFRDAQIVKPSGEEIPY